MTWGDVLANIDVNDEATITNFKNNNFNYDGLSSYDKAWFNALIEKEKETPDEDLTQDELDVVALVWTQEEPTKGDLSSAADSMDEVLQVDSLIDGDNLQDSNSMNVKWSQFRTHGTGDDAAYTDRETLFTGIDYENLTDDEKHQITNFAYAQAIQDNWTDDWSGGYLLKNV